MAENLDNFDFLTSLKSLKDNGEDTKLIEIFEMLDTKLRDLRTINSIHKERMKNSWNDPDMHFRTVLLEEVRELNDEWNDNYTLFKLASFLQHDKIMYIMFARMIDNLDNIRIRIADRTERSKLVWDDPKIHQKEVEDELLRESELEVQDLLRMYRIAKDFEFNPGIELTIKRLEAKDINVDSLKNGMKK